MIENVNVEVQGKKIAVMKGMSLSELSKQFQSGFKYPIIIAKVNGQIKELSEKIEQTEKIEFFDLTSRVGNRIYVKGLLFLNLYAIKELWGMDADMLVEHSIDKGLYITVNQKLTEEKIKQLEDKMHEIVKRDMDINRMNVDRNDAIEYFESVKDLSKVGIMRYNTSTYVTLYRLGNLYDYFYNYMPISTSLLDYFALTYLNESGYVLRFPTIYTDGIKEYTHHANMFEVFRECRDWAKLMHVQNVSDLNDVVCEGHIGDLIRIDETLQSNRLLEAAKRIYKDKDRIKLILLAGPSSSGKTTTCNKLCMYLRSFGLNPKMLSMDNYFVDREKTPKDKDGNYDFENLHTVDLPLFEEQVASLLKQERVDIPTYNFILGTKEYKRKLQLQENDILMIEGIHALNNTILENVKREQKFKIYISALTELNLDNHNRISTTDNRLLRRMIRDNRTRGYQAEETLKNWPIVRRGEEENIFPFQDEADFTFNSALIYELGVLKTYGQPLLHSISQDSPYYEEAKRLIDFLRLFQPIPSEAIPQDSLLREFIGGSCFE